MKQYKVVLALVPVLVLAGCIGGPGVEQGPSDPTNVSADQVPGVSNGTLSNASALVAANQKAVTTNGAILQVNQSSDRMTIAARLVIGADFSTYSLSGTGSAGDDTSTAIDQWSNETTQIIRTSSDGQTNYQVLAGHDDRLTILSPVTQFLSAGDFEVANDSSSDGTVVLTADNVSAASTSMPDAESFDGRLVVNESGQIQNLSVTVTRSGETVSYSYELRQAGVESVAKPDWIDDVPPGATVQAQLTVNVENDSYLTLEHAEGDTVPNATTVRVESNGTTATVSLNDSLSAGDTRYLFFDASSQQLRVTADRPEQSTISPVTSPASVRIVTEGGAVLHSGSMGWGSESASENGAGSSSGSTTTEGTTSNATASPSR